MSGKAQAQAQAACRHCGTWFQPDGAEEEFCCSGCRFVYGLIHREGLERFYDLKGTQTIGPVGAAATGTVDADWLCEAVAASEKKTADKGSKGVATLLVDVQGISCVACVWLIEIVFDRQPGALRMEVNAQRGEARLWWSVGEFDAAGFAQELRGFGYQLGQHRPGVRGNAESQLILRRLAVCSAFALNAMVFTLPRYLGMSPDFSIAGLFELVTIISATLCLLVGGSYFFNRAYSSVRERRMHIDTPISLGLIAAYMGSVVGWLWHVEALLYFDFVAIFVTLMLLGRWMQQVSVEKNRNRLLAGDVRPGQVRICGEGGAVEEVDVDEVEAGAVYLVRPGEMIPVTSELLSEEAALSYEWINGEPEVKDARRGRRVPGGVINVGRGETRLRAREVYGESLLARLLRQEDGETFRNRPLERVLQVYLVLVLLVGIGGGAAWLAASGSGAKALQVFISVLVVSCPCALGVALPLADEMAVSRLRREGLFVRLAELWGKLRGVKRVVFDKTGTLTQELPVLENVKDLDGLDEEEKGMLLELVRDSYHPLSRVLHEELLVREAVAGPDDDGCVVEEVIGQGVMAEDDGGMVWSLGKPGWKSGGGGGDDRGLGGASCDFSRGGERVARFQFREALRPDAVEEVAYLKRRVGRVSILSGDRAEKVAAYADALGLSRDDCHGGMSPGEKGAWLETRDPERTLYVGDGANDSLAFDVACCRGTPAVERGVLEKKADFYYLGRGLRAIRALFEVAARRRRAVRQVFVFAVVYNLVAAAICLGGWMSPLAAAILMPLSSLATLALVAANLRSHGDVGAFSEAPEATG